MISERPAEVEDRAVPPGHWEGDLLLGKKPTGIATLVERSTRYCQLVALPDGQSAEAVSDALVKSIGQLPAQLRRSLTWDQGREMKEHLAFSVASGVEVYFCDPRSPWQRGSNENTNGLLRQYFPKRSDLSRFTQKELDAARPVVDDFLLDGRRGMGFQATRNPCRRPGTRGVRSLLRQAPGGSR